MCMLRVVTPKQKEAARQQAAAGAALQHQAAKDVLHTGEDPLTCFAASVVSFGPPKVAMTPEQEAYWRLRSRLDEDDVSGLCLCAAECLYTIKAKDLPVRQSLPGTGGRDYNTILEEMRAVKGQLWRIALVSDEEAVSEQKKLLDKLDELREEAIACLPGDSDIVFGSAINDPFYVVQGRPNALENTCQITEKAFPKLDVVSLTTPVDIVESDARAKGGATRSAKSVAGKRMRGGEHSWPDRPEVPVFRFDNGVQSFTIYGPAGVSMMLACKQELWHLAHELDAALQARGEEPEHVNALNITMQQVAACEQMYRTMEEAGKSWKAYFGLILSVECDIMLDDGALGAFLDERVDSLVFNLMPPGSNASSGISYVAVNVGTERAPGCLPVPCMDKHVGDKEFPEMVPGPTGNFCILGPPGLIATGKLGGTSVQTDTDMCRFVNPTLGERLPDLSALGTSTVMDPANGEMHATVQVVLQAEMSMQQTKNACRELFSGDIAHSVLTLVKVVCGERYSNVERDEDGMVVNQSFKIEFCPVHAHASTGTSLLFTDLVSEETSGADELHNLVVVDSTHDGAPSLLAGTCGSSFTVERASARAGPVPVAQEHPGCFFGTDEKNMVCKVGVVRPGENDSEFRAYEHLPALRKVLLNPQSAFRLPDGTMKHGLEGLRAALGVRTLGELMYFGMHQTMEKEHTITVTKHDGKEDEIGEPVDMSMALQGLCRKSPCLALEVPSGKQIRVKVKAVRRPLRFKCILLQETGEQEPEDEVISREPTEKYELPFPLEYANTEDPGGWCLDFGNNSLLNLFFYVEGKKFQPSTWGDECLFPPSKRRKM